MLPHDLPKKRHLGHKEEGFVLPQGSCYPCTMLHSTGSSSQTMLRLSVLPGSWWGTKGQEEKEKLLTWGRDLKSGKRQQSIYWWMLAPRLRFSALQPNRMPPLPGLVSTYLGSGNFPNLRKPLPEMGNSPNTALPANNDTTPAGFFLIPWIFTELQECALLGISKKYESWSLPSKGLHLAAEMKRTYLNHLKSHTRQTSIWCQDEDLEGRVKGGLILVVLQLGFRSTVY